MDFGATARKQSSVTRERRLPTRRTLTLGNGLRGRAARDRQVARPPCTVASSPITCSMGAVASWSSYLGRADGRKLAQVAEELRERRRGCREDRDQQRGRRQAARAPTVGSRCRRRCPRSRSARPTDPARLLRGAPVRVHPGRPICSTQVGRSRPCSSCWAAGSPLVCAGCLMRPAEPVQPPLVGAEPGH